MVEKQIDIYVLKNPLTELVHYVGQTGRGKKRMYEHNSRTKKPKYPAGRWIAKLRRSKVKPIFEVVDTVPKSQADEAEKKYILLFKSFGALLYNLSIGGNGNLLSENHNSKKLKGKHFEDYYSKEQSDEIKNKIKTATSGSNNPFFGHKWSAEAIEKNRKAQSTTPLIVKDKEGNVVGEFMNSKDAALALGCGASLIRESKNKGWYVRHKFLVTNK